MKNKLFFVSLIALSGVISLGNSSSLCSVSADDDVYVSQVDIAHQEDGYDLLVGEEIELKQDQFTYLPENASDKSVKYAIQGDSFEGDLPPAMFSSVSTSSFIVIKGLAVGDFKVYFPASDGKGAYTSTTFHVCAELPDNAQRDGISVYKTQEENGVTPGATDCYVTTKSGETVENATPIYVDGEIKFSAIPAFLSQIFTTNVYIIIGGVIIGLMFLYILLYSIKKAIFKARR